MIEITFLGRGGQGAFTSSRILGAAVSLYEKKYSLSFPSFGPERRGAPVFAYTKIDDVPIRNRSQSLTSDYIVVLDESLFNDNLLARLKPNGRVIINTVHREKYTNANILTFDATEVASEYLGAAITNTAMLAVLIAYTKVISLESLLAAIDYDMSEYLAQKNKGLVKHIVQSIGGRLHV